MSFWWLTYNRRGRLHGVVVVETASLISACVGVADNALDKGVSFVEGHELDAEHVAGIPPGYVGMMLSHKEARQLLNRMERHDDKRR
jgi:predicted thioesterase